MAINYTVAKSDDDLLMILDLQKKNLLGSLSEDEQAKEGFVTIDHDLALLRSMNSPHPHIVAMHDQKLVGYALVMLKSLTTLIPLIVSLVNHIGHLSYRGKPLKDAKYFIMGQICISKGHRGQGIFQKLYAKMALEMSSNFDYIITEISTNNTRSMRAHEKVGFETLHEFVDEQDRGWVIVLLDIMRDKK